MTQRVRTSLAGLWTFSIPGGTPEQRVVPGSYGCVGDSLYRKRLVLTAPEKGRRLRLCFEGIAYEGQVFFNGEPLGSMLPYSYYAFDLTDRIREGRENEILLELKDLNAVFGPAEGWKSYSGIVREVYLEEISALCFEDVFFTYTFAPDYAAAHCHIQLTLDGPEIPGLHTQARLLRGDTVYAQGSGDAKSIDMELSHPLLWSPEQPNLYQLEVTLEGPEGTLDTYTCQAGFKDLVIRGNRFLLNGQDLFLAGVCRHDLWTEEGGFTQTQESIDLDLNMIKHMGANYVRLVHYPHDRRVVEAADRIGLLVSEEPGLWWSDLSNRAITSRALKVLEKVIYRDRNHVSVAFWLSFNECRFQEDFLREAVAVARRCDPTRLISGANCNDPHETKEMFDKCGIDFYTMHPYGTHPSHVNGGSLEEVCRILSGKPLVFTEWGGYFVVDNPALFTEFCQTMRNLHRSESPSLAGMSYWQWQDIPEAQRGLPACVDGILTEGLVTMDRKPKVTYFSFMKFLDQLRRPEMPAPVDFRITGGGSPEKVYTPLPLPQPAKNVWQEAVEASTAMAPYHWKQARRIMQGPAVPYPTAKLGALTVDLPQGLPRVLSLSSGPLEIPVDRAAQALWFVGQATMGKGYPLGGDRGEEFGRYVLTYEDGREQIVPLRNGLEAATVFGLVGPTAFDPRAAHTSRAFSVSYDKNWEIYHTGLLRVPAEPGLVKTIRAEVTLPGYFLLLYGVSAEEEK